MGLVFNIQRFCVNDGPGIRTSVFLKGCPLRCLWCHNPESQAAHPEMSYHGEKCLHCGQCVPRCPRGCHTLTQEGHIYNREKCTACGSCMGWQCSAMERIGEEKTARVVLDEVLRDKAFYGDRGGMTVTGGEPLFQFDFTLELLTLAKAEGLHTCIETCGFAPWERVAALLPVVDLFLWDVKELDSRRHQEYTGVPNELILENLRRLDQAGGETILRCPVIPGYNLRPEHFAAIAALAEELTHVREIQVEPYHPLGSGKCRDLGRVYALEGVGFPEQGAEQDWIAAIAAGTRVPVSKA